MKKLILVSAILLATGCSSIVNGSKEMMNVSVTPSGAKVTLESSNGSVLRTEYDSLNHELKRGDGYFEGKNYVVKVEKEGFQTQSISINSEVSGMYLGGNILFGGLIGWFIVDPYTGGMWNLEASNEQDLESMNITLIDNNGNPAIVPQVSEEDNTDNDDGFAQ